MVDIVELINKKYENKYKFLKLLNVVYDVNECTITFLYPYTIDEIDKISRKEIEIFIQEFLSLNKKIHIKYKKSFLDEKLIIEEIIEYFKDNKKSLAPYIQPENITSEYKGLTVNINLTLNQDILSLVNDFELKTEIKDFLEKIFIADFNINIIENEEKLPDEIEAEDIVPVSNTNPRYNVNIEKKLIGGDIVPRPEYIKNIKKPVESVILSGFVSSKAQETFIVKKGKNAGKEKSLYTFNIKDETSNIDCVYFCAKTYEKIMEDLEDLSLVICVGDVRLGLTGKLTYYIKKMSLASPCQEIEIKHDNNLPFKHKKVVFPEMLSREEQSNLFDKKPEYTEFIKNNNIVVFDLETTGLDPETCEITEIGAVKIEHGEITEKFSSFARTKEPIPLEVQQLTHITNEMIADAPDIKNVVKDFYDWSRDCVISGYNVIGFDMKFLKKAGSSIELDFDNEVVDTMNVVRKSGLRTTNYKLGTVVKTLGLTLLNAHRAYNDAYATALVLLELNKI